MAIVTILADDPVRSAAQRREEIIEEAKRRADREFVAVVRRALRGDSAVNVASRAGMGRGNIYRLLNAYPEEG